jgi:predicted NUDIX family NTP pyrophosphohydrolase
MRRYRWQVPKLSAGLLPFRHRDGELEVFIVHPGGPFWANKDAGAWSIAKGEYESDEDPLETARREFAEEVGIAAPTGEPMPLGQLKQASGKLVTAYAVAADFEVDQVTSNTFTLEWPRGSGLLREFPEVDDGRWMSVAAARTALVSGQREFLDRLAAVLAEPDGR